MKHVEEGGNDGFRVKYIEVVNLVGHCKVEVEITRNGDSHCMYCVDT